MLLAIEAFNGRLGFLVVAHFHETEFLAAVGFAIRNDLGAVDGTEGSKQVFQVGAADTESQISDIQSLSQDQSPVGVQTPVSASEK